MKTVLTLIAAFALAAAVQPSKASAASNQSRTTQAGQISDAQLAQLGLTGMERLSDSQGEQVRGKFLLRGLRINIIQNNTGRDTVTNFFLSSPFQIFTLLGR